jgi:thiol-disulfide isomerase/thioredoxin
VSAKTVVIIAFLLLVIGAGTYAAVRGSDDAAEPAATATTEALPAAQKQAPARVAGTYVDYEEGVIQKSDGERVLFFHAPWCPQCRSIEKGIKEDGVPDGLTVIKVDYDSNQELREQYGVTIQTTFVKVDEDGKAIGKPFVAYDDPTFDSVKRNFLD